MPSLLAYGDSAIQTLGCGAREVASGFRNTQKFPEKIQSNQSINHLSTTSVTIHSTAHSCVCVWTISKDVKLVLVIVFQFFCRGSQAHHTYLTQRSNGMAEEAQSDQLCVPALRNNLDFLFLFRVDKLLVPPMYGVQNSCLAHTVPHIPI